jgi:predicted RNA binding protein YcfA (HicA-like mRNA interferase family)
LKLPRDLNGTDLAKSLRQLQFEEKRQTGSHIVLQHLPTGETISVPAHRPLKIGTLQGIVKAVCAITGLSRHDVVKFL